MAARFLLRLPAVNSDRCEWKTLPNGEMRQGKLTEFSAMAKEAEVIVAVPGETCMLSDVNLPVRGRRQRVAALSYALEDSLLDDAEAYHVAVGPSIGGDRHAVAAVLHEQMRLWLTEFEEAGMAAPVAMVPEALLLPYQEQSWTILLENDWATVRAGAAGGFSCDLGNLPFMLESLLKKPGSPERLRVLTGMAAMPKDTLAELEQLAEKAGKGKLEIIMLTHALAAFSSAEGASILNLLQLTYAPSSPWREKLLPWRPAFALAASWVVLQIAITGMDYLRYDQQSTELQTQVTQYFRQTFPEIQRIVNPKIQMNQQLDLLRRGRQNQGFLPLLGEVSPVLTTLPGFALQTMRYQDGTLDLTVKTQSVQALEATKTVLAGKSFDMTIVSVSTTNDGVSGRLTIRRRS